VQEDRRDAAEADEDGGGGDEKLFSAAKPLSTGIKYGGKEYG
jgi:hypothetical protein